METKLVTTTGESKVGDVLIKYNIQSNGQISGTVTGKDSTYLGNLNLTEKGGFGIYFKEETDLSFPEKTEVIKTMLADLAEVITGKK